MVSTGHTAYSRSFPCKNGKNLTGMEQGRVGAAAWFLIQAQFSSCYLSSCELLKINGMHAEFKQAKQQNPRLGHCYLQDTTC